MPGSSPPTVIVRGADAATALDLSFGCVSAVGLPLRFHSIHAFTELPDLVLKQASYVDQVGDHHRKRVLIENTIGDPCFQVVDELANIRYITHFRGPSFPAESALRDSLFGT
jgi:hypothetical protein